MKLRYFQEFHKNYFIDIIVIFYPMTNFKISMVVKNRGEVNGEHK